MNKVKKIDFQTSVTQVFNSGQKPYLLNFPLLRPLAVQWKLDLADTSFADNLGLKDTLQKILATVFDF